MYQVFFHNRWYLIVVLLSYIFFLLALRLIFQLDYEKLFF